MIFGLGRSSTRVIPSVRSGWYSPGAAISLLSRQRTSSRLRKSAGKAHRLERIPQFLCYSLRNCQNMDEDEFTLQGSPAAVKFDEKVRLIVVNNTAANSTMLRIEPDAGKGDLKLAPGAPP